jgi:LmbE family N-acetylglucosaminyl deacetylase
LNLSECPGLVVVGAHPDDETLGLGGMIGALCAAGVRVVVVSARDGGAAYPAAGQAEQACLERLRRDELAEAAGVLGVAETVHLGMPDGKLTECEAALADELTVLLGQYPDGVWCAATWRGDGHPDHEAVGRAARIAAQRIGVPLLEYPVWMWHWAEPGDAAVPWERARTVPLTKVDRARKQSATRCFRSQLQAPTGDIVEILPPFVVRRLLAVGEVVFC